MFTQVRMDRSEHVGRRSRKICDFTEQFPGTPGPAADGIAISSLSLSERFAGRIRSQFGSFSKLRNRVVTSSSVRVGEAKQAMRRSKIRIQFDDLSHFFNRAVELAGETQH